MDIVRTDDSRFDGIGWEKSEATTSATLAVRFNQDSDLYKDVNVRRALQMAVDNAVVLELGFDGQGSVAENHHVCPIHPEYAKLPPLVVDPAKAKEMIYSGRFYSAQDCYEMGLVQKVVSGDESVIEYAQKIASRYAKGAAVALAMAKKSINKGMECSIEEGLIIEAQSMSLCFASEDQTIGMRTFLEEGSGKAKFTGK